jgi:cellobiose phosphorylase
LPPVGIIVWTWAELIMLFVHHMVGIRPQEDSIIIRPKLLNKLKNLDASFTIRNHKISLAIKRRNLETFAVVNGKKNKMPGGTLIIPYPENDISVEIFLKE